MIEGGANPSSTHSQVLEKTLEHVFLGSLCAYLWSVGEHEFAVSQSEVDHYGYDVVVEVGAIVRHIQLKAGRLGHARSRKVPINMRLGEKPSGCVIWMIYRPDTLVIDHYRWFGGEPGARLPSLGDRIAQATKANALGVKALKQGHRALMQSDFITVANVARLADLLFGPHLEALGG